MQSHIGHIQFNVEAANLPFYRDLTAFLGWQTLYDTAEFIGVADPSGTSLWFIGYVKPVSNDYDGPGLNHLAFSVPAQADVDARPPFSRRAAFSTCSRRRGTAPTSPTARPPPTTR